MDKSVSITLSAESANPRKLAQRWYNLSDEQMRECDVHHNPPRSKGGRNIPEHIYVYHTSLHSAVHSDDFTKWARKGYDERKKRGTDNKKGVRTGGGPPRKTKPTAEELTILKLRQNGMSREEVADLLGIPTYKVKRAVRECSKFGYKLHLKPGPKKGCSVKPVTKNTVRKIKEKRKDCVWWYNVLTLETKLVRECPGPGWARGRKPK
jgi:hypothetical protein